MKIDSWDLLFLMISTSLLAIVCYRIGVRDGKRQSPKAVRSTTEAAHE